MLQKNTHEDCTKKVNESASDVRGFIKKKRISNTTYDGI